MSEDEGNEEVFSEEEEEAEPFDSEEEEEEEDEEEDLFMDELEAHFKMTEEEIGALKAEEEQVKKESRALATAMIERLGGESPARLLVGDLLMFRIFCESFVARHPLVEAVSSVADADALITVLQRLAINDTAFDKERVVRSGIAEAIVSQVLRFPKNAVVQYWGITALDSLYYKAKHLVKEVIGAGAIEVIVGAMKAHSGDEGLCSVCVGAASNMFEGGEEEIVAHLVSAGIVDSVLAVTKANSESPGILFLTTVLLGKLAIDAEAKVVLLEKGGIDAVVEVMAKWHDDPNLMTNAELALGNMSVDQIGRLRVGEKGLPSIVSAMAEHSGELSVQEEGGNAFVNILATRESHGRFCTPEIEGLLRAAVENFPDSVELRHSFESVTRKEGEEIKDAVDHSLCTAVRIPRCSNPPCTGAFYCYCKTCFRPQRMFACLTCDGRRTNIRYCEPCFLRCGHHTHSVIEAFEPGSCYCDPSTCRCREPTKRSISKGEDEPESRKMP